MPHGSPHFPVDVAGGLSLPSSPVAVTAAPGPLASVATVTPPPAGIAIPFGDGASTGSVAGNGSALNGTVLNGLNGNGVAANGLNGNHGIKSPHIPLGNPGQGNGRSRIGTVEGKPEPAPATSEPPKPFKLSRRTQTLLGIQIVGCGSYVPDNVITNEQLEQRYGFEPGWIQQRTGILARRHAPPGVATSDLCYEAAVRCLRSARVNASDVDLLVVGTFTPDYPVPSAACLVQDRLGLDAPAIEVQSACSGFVYALVTAAQYVATGNSKMALVIGGDINSRIVNPGDQKTAPLFGDAAGAVLLTRGGPHQGLVCYQIGADGSGAPLLRRPLGGSLSPLTANQVVEPDHFLRMDGRSVFKWAVRALTDTIELLLNKTGMSVHDVSLYLLHQANQRIIAHAMDQLGIPSEKVFNNLEKYGNTSAGSIPLAMDEAYRAGRIRRGDTLMLCGFGAGLSWGTALFRW